jgi:hypothetical protein
MDRTCDMTSIDVEDDSDGFPPPKFWPPLVADWAEKLPNLCRLPYSRA